MVDFQDAIDEETETDEIIKVQIAGFFFRSKFFQVCPRM